METERMKRPKYLTCRVNAQSTEMLKVPAGGRRANMAQDIQMARSVISFVINRCRAQLSVAVQVNM